MIKKNGVKKESDYKKWLKYLLYFLETVTVLLLLYIIFLPFYPAWQYGLTLNKAETGEEVYNMESVKRESAQFLANLPGSEYNGSADRIIIPKIGVNAPIVESNSVDYGLNNGAWLVPETSTPDLGGNTVITGHRFKYLPPHNLTFYLFHKLEPNDLISVIWKEKYFIYKIKEIKIVPKTEVSILNKSIEPILTLYTCHPIYSTEERLVVIAGLVSDEENTEIKN